MLLKVKQCSDSSICLATPSSSSTCSRPFFCRRMREAGPLLSTFCEPNEKSPLWYSKAGFFYASDNLHIINSISVIITAWLQTTQRCQTVPSPQGKCFSTPAPQVQHSRGTTLAQAALFGHRKAQNTDKRSNGQVFGAPTTYLVLQGPCQRRCLTSFTAG